MMISICTAIFVIVIRLFYAILYVIYFHIETIFNKFNKKKKLTNVQKNTFLNTISRIFLVKD